MADEFDEFDEPQPNVLDDEDIQILKTYVCCM